MKNLIAALRFMPYTMCCMLYAICCILIVPSVAVAQEFPGESGDETIALKLMVVNPSPKYKQTFPLKAYLPEEVKPEHILDSDGLQIVYDSEKENYYAAAELELDPGQSVVKTIEIEDVWLIPNERMKELSNEGRELFKKLKGTKFEYQGKLLLSNIETLIIQIYESQYDETLSPEEHISIYRDNKEKIRDIEMDLMALRRLVVSEGGEAGAGFSSSLGAAGLPSFVSDWEAEDMEASKKGTVPVWMLWRVIFIVLIFVGIASAAFFLIWHSQLKTLRKRKSKDKDPEKAKEMPGMEEEVSNADLIEELATNEDMEDTEKEGPHVA